MPLPLASLFASLSARKGSLLVAALLTSVFAKIRSSDDSLTPDDPRLSASLVSVVDARSPWTAAVAQLVHFDAGHLALNLVALWQLGPSCEARGGAGGGGGGGKLTAFLWTSAQLLTLSGALFVGGLFVAARRFGVARAEAARAVGYSAVLFGWMSLLAAEAGAGASFRLLGFLKIPALFSPLLLVLATSLLIPNASLAGHLSGYFAGLVVALGGIDWLTPGLAATLALWAVAAALFWRRAAEMDAAAAADPESGGGLLGSASSPVASPRIIVL